MNDVLEQLKAGIRRFQTQGYPQRSGDLCQGGQRAAEAAGPVYRVRGFADRPRGDHPVRARNPLCPRNIGNLMPAYGEMMGGISAVVEYAVSAAEGEARRRMRTLGLRRDGGV